MSLTPSNYQKFWIFVKLLILRYQFIGITLSKPHLVCTLNDKHINAKKYEWKFGSVQVLLVGDCIILQISPLISIKHSTNRSADRENECSPEILIKCKALIRIFCYSGVPLIATLLY